FFDFVARVDLRLCNRRVFEALIHSGAMDNLGGHRAQFLAVLDQAMQEASLRQAERESGQHSLFGGGGDVEQGAGVKQQLPNLAPFSESERLTKEKEILGFYVSGHPLEPYRVQCELFGSHTVSQFGTYTTDKMNIGCVVTAIKRQISKRSGAEFARLTIEDFTGSAEVLVFPERWAAIGDTVRTDIPVLLSGGYSRRDADADNPAFIVESVQRFAELQASCMVLVALSLTAQDGARSLPPGILKDVRAVVDAHPGSAPLELHWSDGNGSPARFRSRSLTLSANTAALTE